MGFSDMRDMTRQVLYHCVAANNIYACEEEEHSGRLAHLTEAYALCAVLIYDVNKVCEAVLSPDYTGQPPTWMKNVKTSRIREIDASIKKERKLLKGVIEKERDDYREYRRKRAKYDSS